MPSFCSFVNKSKAIFFRIKIRKAVTNPINDLRAGVSGYLNKEKSSFSDCYEARGIKK